MTQKEIDKFLADTKVYVAGKSKEIQEKLFSLGYKWFNGDIEVCYTHSPFLFIDEYMSFSRSDSMDYFSNHQNKEITAEEILSLELTEPKYRPFKDKDECWAEMQKHQPFGWLIRKDSNAYCYICIIFSEKAGFTEDYIYDYKYLYNNYTFADGTPFGIKED